MVKEIKTVQRAAKIQKKAELLERLERLQEARNQQFQDDVKRHFAKTGKQITRKVPNVNDILTVQGSERIKIDLKAEQPADVQREVQMYKITIDNVNKVLREINNSGVATQRPSDYLAQMYKSDKHMEKIRKGLIERQETIKQKMQNKTWQKRKKKINKRQKRAPTSEKKKKISKMMKRKNNAKKNPKAKTQSFKGTRGNKK